MPEEHLPMSRQATREVLLIAGYFGSGLLGLLEIAKVAMLVEPVTDSIPEISAAVVVGGITEICRRRTIQPE